MFSGVNIRYNSYGRTISVWNVVLNRMGKENIDFIINGIEKGLNELKKSDTYAHSIIDQAKYYVSIDNFLSVYEKGAITPEKLKFLEGLVSENPNILDSINYRILEDRIYDMGEEFIAQIAKYPNMSAKLLIVADNNPELFGVIKDGFKSLEGQMDRTEILEIQSKVLKYASLNQAKIKDIKFDDLLNCSLRRDTFNLNEPSVHIHSEDYETDFIKKCDDRYKELSKSSNGKYSKMGDKRDILFKKYFGMNFSDARDFVNRFSVDLESLTEIDSEIKSFVDSIRTTMLIESEDELDKVYYSGQERINPLQALSYEYSLRKEFGKTYEAVLGETDKKLQESPDSEIVDVNGIKVTRINLKGNFNLLVHSTDSGFKGDKKIIDNSFLKSWNHIPDTERHLASCCYITQDFLGHVPANENGVVGVFTKTDAENIGLMGPSDINSNITDYTCSSGRGLYFTAENMPQNSRRVYAEVPVNRRPPDYYLIFDDSTEEVIQNSYKAAAEFGVPVIYIDKVDVKNNQLAVLDSLTEEFKQTKDANVLAKLISMYETNVAGWLLNRDPNEKDESATASINNERFRNDFEQREKVIYDMVQEFVSDRINQGDKETVSFVISTLQNEMDKYNLMDIDKCPISKTKMKLDAQSLIEFANQRGTEKDIEVDDERKDEVTMLINASLIGIAHKTMKENQITRSEVKSVSSLIEPSIVREEAEIDDN